MPYNAINSRRMPYDIDGTAVGYCSTGAPVFSQGISSWVNSATLANLNAEARASSFDSAYQADNEFWFFFPERREITHMALLNTNPGKPISGLTLQGSNDTTNGVDGTWETATLTFIGDTAIDSWRKNIFAVSFSTSYKTIRFKPGMAGYSSVSGIHIYGCKADGQTPDDVIFCQSDGTEFTALKDWGDTTEGSTYNDSFCLKNVSSKQANALNVQLNNADYVISLDQTNWGSVVNIASLSSGQVSQPIYVRKTLGAPPLILGPRSARAILTIGSFS